MKLLYTKSNVFAVNTALLEIFPYINLYISQVMRSHNCYQLVFSSSCTVYGEPQWLPITELHPTGHTTNVYGRTKYFIEEMLKDLSAAEKVTNIFHLLLKIAFTYVNRCIQNSP